jgi:thioesterase domain-containing protein
VLCYRGLAELLNRPCYAFQAPGPAADREPLGKIEDLADLYVRALLQVRPHGPYLLGGWSSGAVIAAEMAHQLEQRGETVDRVMVIDSPAPLAQRVIDDVRLLLWFMEDLDIGFDPARVSTDDMRDLAELPQPRRLDRILALAREQGVPGAGLDHLDATHLAATLAVFSGVVRACNSYSTAHIAADITVLRAQQGSVSEFADHPFAGMPDWGWTSLTKGRVDTAAVPGTHHTVLADRHVVAVADVINGRPRTVQSEV